ncbi:hypothetical protein SHIRM173S_04797 [Streptomyces hirsutus]
MTVPVPASGRSRGPWAGRHPTRPAPKDGIPSGRSLELCTGLFLLFDQSDQFDPGADAERRENVPQVVVDGTGADGQAPGRLPVGGTLGDTPRDTQLLAGSARDRSRAPCRRATPPPALQRGLGVPLPVARIAAATTSNRSARSGRWPIGHPPATTVSVPASARRAGAARGRRGAGRAEAVGQGQQQRGVALRLGHQTPRGRPGRRHRPSDRAAVPPRPRAVSGVSSSTGSVAHSLSTGRCPGTVTSRPTR